MPGCAVCSGGQRPWCAASRRLGRSPESVPSRGSQALSTTVYGRFRGLMTCSMVRAVGSKARGSGSIGTITSSASCSAACSRWPFSRLPGVSMKMCRYCGTAFSWASAAGLSADAGCLRVSGDHQHRAVVWVAREDVVRDSCQVHGQGGLADPAFLVRDDMHQGHSHSVCFPSSELGTSDGLIRPS